MSVPSYVRIERGSYGGHDFKFNKVPLFRSKTSMLEASCPKNSSCASQLLLLRYKLVILQCLCQVSLGFKVVQMGAHDVKLKKVHRFAQRPMDINVLRSAAPKLALVPASRYNCHIYNYMLMSVPNFIRIERGLDGDS